MAFNHALINDWGSVRTFATWEARVSNDPDVSDYQKTDAGLGLSMALRFEPRGLPPPPRQTNPANALPVGVHVSSFLSVPAAAALLDATWVLRAFRRRRIRKVC